MEGRMKAIETLEKAMSRSARAWQWESLRVKKEASGAFDFSHFADRDKGVLTPCHEVAGAPLRIIVATDAWSATGHDLAAFPDDVERLVESFPHYPRALVDLPEPPADFKEDVAWGNNPAETVNAEAQRLEGASGWAMETAKWLSRCSAAITDAVGAIEREGASLRASLCGSSYQDWHINGIDQRAGTVLVMGRNLKVVPGRPTGTREDLDTIHLHTVLEGLWRAQYRPVIRLEAADYGTCRIKLGIGKSHGAGRGHWIDLKQMKPVKPRQSRA